MSYLIKKKLFILCLIMISSYAYTQSVYTYDFKKDIVIGSLSLGMALSPFFVINEPDQIPTRLEKNDINALDQAFMFPYNKTIDIISDYGVYSLLALPALSVIGNIHDNHTLLTYGIMYTEAFLLTLGTKDLLKKSIIRNRPYMYDGGVPDGKEDDYYNSFPSGSTSYAFLGATFLSTTFSQEFPESKWKVPIIIGSYTLAAGIASMRITSGSHFITDVLTGAAIGSFYGWIIPFLHKKQNSQDNLAINFTGNGISVSLKL
ncbi:MAG: phosphatase PAP2 family protein [Treponema sp.]|jgi:membrane-associated phospholipid phosphatase|nr:phosphatase PAP2 family protein [Treponema sp.]